MSHNNNIRLSGKKIPHTPSNEYDDQFQQHFNIEHKGSAKIEISRGGDASATTIDSNAEDVLLLEQQEGIKLIIRRDDFEKDFPVGAAHRGADGEMLFPTSLDFGSPSRGPSNWMVKVLSVFGIKKAAREATAALVEKFEKSLKPGPGFYRIEQADKVKLIAGAAPTSVNKPLLLFIHGTASSTEGSFGTLWTDQSPLADELFEHYEQRVFAFEHRTLSESPIENAHTLIKKIPAGATLHLVSHSRGGLVGELLCRGTVAEGLPAFSKADLEIFSARAARKVNAQSSDEIKKIVEKAYAVQVKELQALGKELDKKRIKVERFVRVACPARGTTLASGRLDRWLSIMLNLIGLVPALGQSPLYGLFKNFALALVENKARPDEIPGLEAQMPDSPLVSLLNTSTNQLLADLSVISGDIEKNSLFGRIALLAPDKFYGGEHDLVVNTASMYGGGARVEDARFLSVQGSNVSHFNYFRNSPTAKALLQGLTAPGARLSTVFTSGLPELKEPIPRGVTTSRNVPQPVVFIVPGIMGSELSVHGDCVWVNMLQLVNGGMDKLNMEARNVVPERILSGPYASLVDHLSKTHEVITFPFDWRKSLSTQVQRFAKEIKKKLVQQQAHDQPLRIVAHSMGGLLTRLLMIKHPELWNDIMRHRSARFIMLGTPNGGSFAVPRILLGQNKLLKTLALIDIRNSHEELLDIIRRYPGLLELLPDFGSQHMDLFDRATWEHIAAATGGNCPVPDKPLLTKAKNFRTLLDLHPLRHQDREKIIYIAGVAAETPIGLHIEKDKVVFKGTARGDGTVSWDSGIPANTKTWFIRAVHDDLADHPPAFEGIQELLTQGDTDKLERKEPVRARGVEDIFDMAPDEVSMYPNQHDLQKTLMGGEYRIVPKKTAQQQVKVFVSHGDLTFARNPVAVGHYEGDGQLFSAEKSLDKCLDNELTKRLRLGVYPGEIESCAVVMNTRGRKPRGAIVIGLGKVGKLNVRKLLSTFSYALRNYGMREAERRSESTAITAPIGLKVSSLIIGCSAGGLPDRDALLALLKGTVAANKALAETYADAPVYIEELEFIEWFEDSAISAISILRDLAGLEQKVKTHFDLPETLRNIGGGRRRICFAEAPGWWQRLQILQGEDGALRFNSITNRARTEVNLLATDRKKVDHFLQTATRSTHTSTELAHTLFEMLLPNELKERANDATNLLLILNEQAARYPWELISDRWARNREPLAVASSVIRQLESTHYRRDPNNVHEDTALIIGEPDSWADVRAGEASWSRLPGALEEAQLVHRKLNGDAFQSEASFNENGFEILGKLHRKAYRVLHLAGHGVFDYLVETDEGECEACNRGIKSNKAVSGMVIGSNMFLTPADVEQMRHVPELVFINCCHLGSTEDSWHKPLYPSLAANLAVQFIRMGVRAVVAAGWEVDDSGAKTFANTFYDAMLAGHEFGDAVQRARKASYDNHPGINTWGAYQCYGDPHYTLRDKQHEHESYGKAIVSPSELVLELENIFSRANSVNAKMTAQHVTRVVSLANQTSDRGWTHHGDVCAAFGRTYGALDEFDRATQWYERSLQAESAQQPLATLEQLANLQTRRAVRGLQQPKPSRTEKETAVKQLEAGIEILEQLCKPVANIASKTSNRLALLGSAYKRKAQLDVICKRKPVAALKKMLAYYQESHQYHEQHNAGEIDFYPYSNYLTAKILLHLFDRVAQTKPDAAELKTLVELEAQADARDREDPGFWNLVGSADCRLAIHLINEDLQDHSADIAQRYLDAETRNANAREFQTIIEHVTFLSVMINDAARRAQALQKGTTTRPKALSKTQAGVAALLAQLTKEN